MSLLLKSLLSPVTSQVLGKMPGSAHLLLPDVVTLGQSHAASPEMEEWVTGLLGKPQTEHRQAWSRRHSEVPARDVVAFPAETSAPVSTEEQTVCPSSGRGRQASSVARSPLDRYSRNPREHACGTRDTREQEAHLGRGGRAVPDSTCMRITASGTPGLRQGSLESRAVASALLPALSLGSSSAHPPAPGP